METQLFDIQLNDQGKNFLDRINFWAKFFYVCAGVTCVADVSIALLSIRWFKYYDAAPTLLKFRFTMYVTFLVIYAILLPVQAYLFYQFSSRSKKAIYTEEFNNSFKWLLQQVILASILFALNSLWAVATVVMEIKTPVR